MVGLTQRASCSIPGGAGCKQRSTNGKARASERWAQLGKAARPRQEFLRCLCLYLFVVGFLVSLTLSFPLPVSVSAPLSLFLLGCLSSSSFSAFLGRPVSQSLRVSWPGLRWGLVEKAAVLSHRPRVQSPARWVDSGVPRAPRRWHSA